MSVSLRALFLVVALLFAALPGQAQAQATPPQPCPNILANCDQGTALANAQEWLAYHRAYYPPSRNPTLGHIPRQPGSEFAQYTVWWDSNDFQEGTYFVNWYRAMTFPGLPDNPCDSWANAHKCTRAAAQAIAGAAVAHKQLESPDGGWLNNLDMYDATYRIGYYCARRTLPGWASGCYFAVYFAEPVPPLDGENLGEQCPTCGNPIAYGVGNKFQVERDVDGPLEFVRYYNSDRGARVEDLGLNWTHTYSRAVRVAAAGPVQTAVVLRPDGGSVDFTLVGGAWVADPNETATLTRLVDGAGAHAGWRFEAVDGRESEEYDAEGRLLAIRRADGNDLVLGYTDFNAGLAPQLLLTSVTDARGRTMTLAYDTKRRLAAVTDPAGEGVVYTYDSAHRLTTVSSSDGGTRTYVYGETAHTAGAAQPWLLTGIVDQENQRFATFKYDSTGRGVSTEHAGGVERFTVDYSTPGVAVVTDPSGATTTDTFGTAFGKPVVNQRTVTCAGCTPRTSSSTRDGNGRPDVRTAANGVTTDYDFDARGRLLRRVDAANDTTGAKRTIEIDWHAQFAVPLEQRVRDAAGALVGKEVRTYNARGQVLTSSTIDPATLAARTTTWQYCEAADVVAGSTCPVVGLRRSVDGPLAGNVDRTTYTYRATDDLTGCASATGNCHRKGDLHEVVDALGHVVAVERYDLAGRPTQVRDANQVVTTIAYDPAGRIASRSVLGADAGSTADDATTVFAYDAIGQLERVTDPAGAIVDFTYDAAHRLTVVEDALGNRISYRLDAAGRSFEDEVRDSGGVLRNTVARVYDGFGQLETLADAEANPTDFAYDAIGNLDTATDALGRTTDRAYDALGRLRESIANVAGTGAQRAQTRFGYDALDRLTSVLDPKGLATTYDYDGLGNLEQLVSPDTGTASYGYDAAGNRTSVIDARGVHSQYAYDGLNRLSGIDRPTAGQDVTFAYDVATASCVAGETFAVGRLAQMTDASGDTRFCYDRRGNLVRKVQAVNGAAASRTLRYSYDLGDRVTSMTYPSGATVTYTRDASGRITGVTAKPTATAATVTIVSDIDYAPFGPATLYTFGNGRTLAKTFDLNYGIDAVTDSAAGGLSIDLGLDDVGNVTAVDERLATGAVAARTVSYDGLDRLTALKNGATNVQAFTYDATGNRTKLGSTVYTYDAGSHRLTKNGSAVRTYDAAGNGTAIGTRTFTYDDAGRMAEYLASGVVTRTFAFNGIGQRVAKKVPGTPGSDTYFVYDEAGHLIGEYRGNGARVREYVWVDDTPVAVFVSHGGTTYQYVLTDHLNTPRAVVLPTTNAIVWRWDITGSAFGEHAVAANPDGDANSYTLPLRYPGQYHDTETKLYYNYFRDYDPTTGRYLQSDPIGLRGGISTFGYAGGSPVRRIDPLGLTDWTLRELVFLQGRLPKEIRDRLPPWMRLAATVTRGNFVQANMQCECAEDGTWPRNAIIETPPGGLVMPKSRFEPSIVAFGKTVDEEASTGVVAIRHAVISDGNTVPNPAGLSGEMRISGTVDGTTFTGTVTIGDASGTVTGTAVGLPDGAFEWNGDGVFMPGSDSARSCR